MVTRLLRMGKASSRTVKTRVRKATTQTAKMRTESNRPLKEKASPAKVREKEKRARGKKVTLPQRVKKVRRVMNSRPLQPVDRLETARVVKEKARMGTVHPMKVSRSRPVPRKVALKDSRERDNQAVLVDLAVQEGRGHRRKAARKQKPRPPLTRRWQKASQWTRPLPLRVKPPVPLGRRAA